MIENMNDLFSLISLGIIVIFLILLSIRSFLKKRERKMIEREIEYYKEW
jgi:hypothetical protein